MSAWPKHCFAHEAANPEWTTKATMNTHAPSRFSLFASSASGTFNLLLQKARLRQDVEPIVPPQALVTEKKELELCPRESRQGKNSKGGLHTAKRTANDAQQSV